MRVLALDTSTRTGSIALLEDEQVVAALSGDPVRPHAARLPADVIDLLDGAGLALADIDLFAVAAGPGSFTGIRIGIAAMQGFALVTGRRMVAISLLDALAHVTAPASAAGTRIATWIDAHRREVYSALYAVEPGPPYSLGRLRTVDPARAGRPEAILDDWHRQGQDPDVVTGDGATLYGALVGATASIVPAPPLAAPVGRLALTRARARQTVGPSGVQPLYVRRPDVEIARDQRRQE